MTDPGMLPSAIMQVTGTLLGIFVVVYVLTLERFWTPKIRSSWSVSKIKEYSRMLDISLIIIIICSYGTFVFNYSWLEILSKNESWMSRLGLADSTIEIGAEMFFGCTLLGILEYLLMMIWLRRRITYKRKRQGIAKRKRA